VTYSFEDYSLDPDRRELRRGSLLVSVEPQVFDFLHCLISLRNRVVAKDELIAAVWGGRIVSESTFSSRVTAVRQAIGYSGEQQRLIRTIARRGLRFIGEVREEHRSEPSDLAPAGPQQEARETGTPAPARSNSAEVRQLSVMICDVIGSVALPRDLIPRTLVRSWRPATPASEPRSSAMAA
jgi:DNA-binding winged helix-turn-helix (wHTH) protein